MEKQSCSSCSNERDQLEENVNSVLEGDDDQDKLLPEEEDEAARLSREVKDMSPGAVKLRQWLNKTLRVEMSDGRVLIGVFLCTDRDANVILGSCTEYLPDEAEKSNAPTEESRMLGLVMIPGKHIVSICIDQEEFSASESTLKSPLSENVSIEEVM